MFLLISSYKESCKGQINLMGVTLQELNLEFKYKKGTKNLVPDHLSSLNFDTILKLLPLNESFLDERLISVEILPWYADIINYLVTDKLPEQSGQSQFFYENKEFLLK